MEATKGEPFLYGINIEDGSGLRLYERVPGTCLLYQGIERSDNLPLSLMFTSGQWRIYEKLKLSWTATGEKDCVANDGGILFHQQEGDQPHSEGWYDHRKNESDVILSVYAFEDCTTYSGANINFQNTWQDVILFKNGNGNMDSCLEKAFSYDWRHHIIVTTKPQTRNTVCNFGQIGSITSVTVTKSDDEEAQFWIGYNNCHTNQIIGDEPANTLHISEARLHNAKFNRLETTENQGTGGLPHGLAAVIGAVGGGAVVLLVLLCVWWKAGWGCCCKEKSVAGPGHYGRASIDSNFQYGEGQEYYHYQKDKNQTRVVDENEMYTNYEHE